MMKNMTATTEPKDRPIEERGFPQLAAYYAEVRDGPSHIDTCAHGLPVVLNRGPGGHWCGYVGVPRSHPYHGKGYDDQIDVSPEQLSRPVRVGRDLSPIDMLTASIRSDADANRYAISLVTFVHGGITFASDHAPGGGPDGYWWFGFDCGHAGDITPKYCSERYPPFEGDVYRTLPYVKGEAVRLAEQLSLVATSGSIMQGGSTDAAVGGQNSSDPRLAEEE